MNDQLAQAILEYDEAYEGPIDSAMEVDAEAWQAWVEMAREHVTYKTIPGFPDYRVGDDGSVWSRRKIGCKSGPGGMWRRLKCRVIGKHYLHVDLREGGRVEPRLVHRLVLEAFVGPCPEGMVACHNDGAQAGHHLANLRWDTQKANIADMKKHGTAPSGSRHGRSKLTEEQVIAFRQHINSITDTRARGAAVAKARKELGISQALTSLILNRKVWKNI